MAENENVIVVDNVTKNFKVYLDKGQSFKERLLFRNRRRHEVRHVLRGISFTVKRGEAVGLIGHNGCGKSTTLKLLTRILYPDSGSIQIKGRVSSLIELGAGFHPDMSGRENIYTNAAIFGLNKKEIDQRLQTIIDFSELEEFIDNPVRTYSSGMYMRLAFSVAINVDADVLLIDEILGVGDANFQAKCFQKLREIKASGTTIVIVSHALGQIEQICERAIWIHDGLIRAEGPVRDVDLEYLEFMGQKMQESTRKDLERKQEQQKERKKSDKNRWGNGKAHLEQISLLDADGQQQAAFPRGVPSGCASPIPSTSLSRTPCWASASSGRTACTATAPIPASTCRMPLTSPGTAQRNFRSMPCGCFPACIRWTWRLRRARAFR